MSITIATTTRTSSTMIENSWSWIFSPSLLSATSDSIIKHQQLHSNHKNDDQSFWIWTAVGLGVYGLKLCTDVLQLYNVSSAWNQRCNGRNNRRRLVGDGAVEDQLPTTKKSLERRALQIEEALTTQLYGELDENKGPNPSQPPKTQKNKTCTTTCELATTTPNRPQLEKRCAICLEDFENDDTIGFSNTNGGVCRHMFHKDCLQHWLEKHTSCPTCRHRMLPDPESMPWLLVPNR